jgi:hypothetical protein
VIPPERVGAVLVVKQDTTEGPRCFLCLVRALLSLILVLISYDEVWSNLLCLRVCARRAGIVFLGFILKAGLTSG